MKKIILFSCIGLFIYSCGVRKDPIIASESILKARLTKDSDAVNYKISLNGVDSTDAFKMQAQFLTYRDQDKYPTRETFWFNRTAMLNIYNLLTKEREYESAHGISEFSKGFTDGIRIYFASDTSVSKGHLINSIIMVSTKNDGKYPPAPSGYKHLDYYSHSKTDILFGNLRVIRGEPSQRNILKNKGQNLYNVCAYCDTTPPCDTTKPHYITQRKAHNMVSHFGTHPISTKSEWFDYNLIKDLALDDVHDGLRIYFARHPKKFKSKPDTNAKKEAFILITTRVDNNNKTGHDDYFDCQTTGQYFGLFDKENLTGGSVTAGGQDNGELCPDNCN